ncbi:hypothetical protein [Erwinia amylovora]|uniref:hypothetical protein n=1 Tax=Erwinia amylovora TaxID=552 RepID=UPI001443A9B2|nr:hypothetical protein [Erwinia amylovora]
MKDFKRNMIYAETKGDIIRLVSDGMDVNTVFKDGIFTPLSLSRNTEVANQLLTLGADINLTNKFGQTALFCNQNFDVILFLIKNGADTEHTDLAGKYFSFNYRTQPKKLIKILFMGAKYEKEYFSYMSSEDKKIFKAELLKIKEKNMLAVA